ncbi:HD-GYP domain-containing protein [Caldichromatium japonicum]|uniref:HD-GYP domain-containing protein n=1 Tax=Caldichromatium japonicum TaxID=2699430 RepID=A0A6G7V9J2_9GAMM|nr:HD-GYP domain-containing protein [Caldichromatium japonicum]QIK36654.1 HD-GYP domain-containing protein [Caldichromatium japonicum]
MNLFRRRAARRIAAISLLLANLASSLAWLVAHERAEEDIVALAMEESRRLLHHFNAFDLTGPDAQAHAIDAASQIVGGLFDIAEIYDPNGEKLAEAITVAGELVEPMLPKHGRPSYTQPSYESLSLPDGRWVLRVFVPLSADLKQSGGPLTGYFEGMRIMPDWQYEKITESALIAALIAGLSSLLCGLVIYPVVVHLSADNERKAREVLDSHISMMDSLGRAIAKRDSDTGAHNYRVAWIAAKIGEALGLSGASMQALIAGSFLHDVGKIGIPDAILLKPGRLTDEEMRIMRTHVSQGEEIVSGMGWLHGAQEVVAAHHEKWDGSGYPRGLAGEAIPLAARIFAVADVFDALTSKRPYKEPFSFEETMAILEHDTGHHFEPAVMKVFRSLSAEIHAQLKTSDERSARALLEECIRRHFDA